METILIIITSYILNLFLNRWIFFRLGDIDEVNLKNPFGKLLCFLSLLGTIGLVILWIIESDSGFFEPKK
ncbi:hypothetical protein COB55_04500 [Candidatus Wolfebacteria bacterium]|nr:MAG: hypothetical protein COB55_04500 [Candidatus Wolfebacteria bacterium]